MDSFNFRDVRVEKANATSKHSRLQKITTLFRLFELFVFVILISRFSTSFSLKLSGEYFRGISITLISPRFVFLVGNAIVIILFLRFSSKKEEYNACSDFHDEYVEKCRTNIKTQDTSIHTTTSYKSSSVCNDHAYQRKMIHRSRSEIKLANGPRHELRRSVTERCRKSEDEMSGEEFRKTVEAFIERQQRFLREEEDFSAVVSVIGT